MRDDGRRCRCINWFAWKHLQLFPLSVRMACNRKLPCLDGSPASNYLPYNHCKQIETRQLYKANLAMKHLEQRLVLNYDQVCRHSTVMTSVA